MDLSLVWLVPVTFFTAIITAVTGAGGGVLLLGLMGLVLPAGAVVPLHGAVMASQNAFRGVLLWKQIDWPFVGMAVVGSVLGAFMVGPLAVSLPEVPMRVVLGLGLLYLVWAPKKVKLPDFRGKVLLLAVVTSMVSMLIGAAGVLFSAVRRRDGATKERALADQSAIMLVQHLLKVLVFGLFGFVFGPYLWLVGMMAVCGLAGTYVGVQLMTRMQNVWFDRVFKAVVSAVAVAMLVTAWRVWQAGAV